MDEKVVSSRNLILIRQDLQFYSKGYQNNLLILPSAPPSYCDALFLGSTGFLEPSTNAGDEDDAPPEYPRQPPFFLRKGAKHLFDSHNVYSTL